MIKHLILFVFSIHSKTMATNVIFSWTFDPFFTFFIDCHVYVPNGIFWGSKSRPHIGDLMMSLFLLWGPPLMTGDGLKMFHFGPKMAKQKVKNRSNCHEKMAVFAIILPWMASYGSERSFLLIFSARDDLVKVSWKSDARKCQNQLTPPYFDQLSERHQLLCDSINICQTIFMDK